MEADNIFNSYYEGQWSELISILKEQIGCCAESGDIVRLSRAFSYYGTVSLIHSDDFMISTLFKQINEEYLHAGDDPRIKASYARFLALHSSFTGKAEDASKYYMDARLSYRLTDWYPDEAIALLESAAWHYLFTEDSAEFYNVLERLEILNHSFEGYLSGDLFLLHSISKRSNSIKIDDIGILEKTKTHKTSMLIKILMSFLGLQDALLTQDKGLQSYESKVIAQFMGFPFKQQQDCPVIQMLEGIAGLVDLMNRKDFRGMDRMMNMVNAKAETFKHPWYKDQLKNQLKELQLRFNAINSNSNGSHETILPEDRYSKDKISVRLFEKCDLSCGNSVFSINSFGTRTGNELLLYLAIQSNLHVPKEVLVEVFFPGEDQEKAYNRLYVNIHRLNKVLQKNFSFLDENDFIFIKQGIACLNSDILMEIDTYKYRKILSVANQLWINDRDAAMELMNQAIGMYSGNIAPGFYYLDWLDDYRLELKNMQLKALNRVFQYYREKDSPKACSEAFHSLIELDPLNEDYYIEYIDYILKDGRNVEAMNLYHKYQICLKKELGLTPSSKLKSLVSRMVR